MAESNEQATWLCGEAHITSIGGEAFLQRAWVQAEGRELLRIGREAAGETPPPTAQMVSEAELIGLLDEAWRAGLFSDFFKRQLFHQVMRRYEEEPETLWTAAVPVELDD